MSCAAFIRRRLRELCAVFSPAPRLTCGGLRPWILAAPLFYKNPDDRKNKNCSSKVIGTSETCIARRVATRGWSIEREELRASVDRFDRFAPMHSTTPLLEQRTELLQHQQKR
ncbi:hypothetical protein F2P81_011439 [Scophthalmus maximus]|uniref:Uncharacterized protein n=1 Tax=Scophthalmus maximus TaxID=52904 RepID=A0A6A4SRT7_SCOMX|nr:hypothetical protein F2P81_011439 [Scophthalmus maximus]